MRPTVPAAAFVLSTFFAAPVVADSSIELHAPRVRAQLDAPYAGLGDASAFFGLQNKIFLHPNALGWFVNPVADPHRPSDVGTSAGYQWRKDRFTLSVEVGRAYRVWSVGRPGVPGWDTYVILSGGIFF